MLTDPAPRLTPTLTPPPSGWHRTTPTGRLWTYANKRRLTCPHGHHFRDRASFTESGFLRCEHWLGDEKRECGAWIFAYAVRGGSCIVAEVQLTERDVMDDLATPAEMIEYLGIFATDAKAGPDAHPAARPPRTDHGRR